MSDISLETEDLKRNLQLCLGTNFDKCSKRTYICILFMCTYQSSIYNIFIVTKSINLALIEHSLYSEHLGNLLD